MDNTHPSCMRREGIEAALLLLSERLNADLEEALREVEKLQALSRKANNRAERLKAELFVADQRTEELTATVAALREELGQYDVDAIDALPV